jgi:hypothetical protein
MTNKQQTQIQGQCNGLLGRVGNRFFPKAREEVEFPLTIHLFPWILDMLAMLQLRGHRNLSHFS